MISKQELRVLMCWVCGKCVLAGRIKVKAMTLDRAAVQAEGLRSALLE